jgi:hypothetical protein
MFIINVNQSTFPLTVEFNTCQILPCGELTSNSSYKDTLLPFITILRAGPDPEALVRLQFPPSRTINSFFLTDYSQNYSCFRYTPLLLAKINSVTHLDWS